MKEDKIIEAVGMIGEDLIVAAKKPKKPSYIWTYVAAAAVLLIIIAGVVMWPEKKTVGNTNEESEVQMAEKESSAEPATKEPSIKEPSTKEPETEEYETRDPALTTPFALAEAVYPQMTGFPSEYDESFNYEGAIWKWEEERNKLANAYCRMDKDLESFYRDTIDEFLCDSDGENLVYSPINLYMALSMLSEVTDGNSREQILNLLGQDSIEDVRLLAKAMWEAHYSANGPETCILGNSLWLNEDIDFNQTTLKELSATYYASAFRGQMGSEEYNEALRTWLDNHTGGLLGEYIKDVEMPAETVLALASTIYFKAKWDEEFLESDTEMKVFHGVDGDEEYEFMSDKYVDHYYWGENFSSIQRRFDNGSDMIFILPDEGVSVDEVLKNDELLDYVENGYKWENKKFACVNLSVPKFDVSSRVDLSRGLCNLGVKDIFDYEVSDFSPITTDIEEIFVSKAEHSARVKIDEEGCEAAAYTLFITEGSAAPPDTEIDFIVDRPFIFVITSSVGAPLFIGVVNNI